MTNREKLLDELGRLDSAALCHLIDDNRLVTILENHLCAECEAIYKTLCPIMLHDDYAPCRLPLEAWMDLPCHLDRLIPEEVLTR